MAGSREIDEKDYVPPSTAHCAGIIPVCGQQYKNTNMLWHPALQPLHEDYLLLDNAITQCAFLGVDTIWIVFDDSMTPFIRKRIGDFIDDPVYKGINYHKNRLTTKRIPIHFVPQSTMEANKRDSVAYTALHAIQTSRKICGQISTYVIPQTYFITFPYSIVDPHEIRENREDIRNAETPLLFTDPENNSVATGHYYPLLITYKQAKQIKQHVYHVGTGVKDMSQPKSEWMFGSVPTKRLPESEQYSARYFGPDEVYRPLYEKYTPNYHAMSWAYDAHTFEGYRKALGSDQDFYPTDFRNLFASIAKNSMSFDDDEFDD